MRVLVTGGSGFIGSHIVDRLRVAGHTPAVLDDLSAGQKNIDSPEIPFFQTDIRDAAAVRRVIEEFRPEAISHQAAQISVGKSVRDPAGDAEVNVVGLLNVLEAAASGGVKRVLFASSGGAMYGEVATPADENAPADPISPYGIAKVVGERYLRFFCALRGLEAVSLRYANVYGPRQNTLGEAAVIAAFCERMLAGEAPTVFGDGSAVRDYVFATDVAAANIAALSAPLPDLYLAVNIGTGEPVTVNQLVALLRTIIAEETGREPPQVQYGPPRAGDIQSNIVDASLARQALGWQPQTSFAEGLRETVRFFLSRGKTCHAARTDPA